MPARVGRIGPWSSEAAQGRQMLISDASRTQCFGQNIEIELRIGCRTRYAANIEESVHAVLLEQADQLVR